MVAIPASLWYNGIIGQWSPATGPRQALKKGEFHSMTLALFFIAMTLIVAVDIVVAAVIIDRLAHWGAK